MKSDRLLSILLLLQTRGLVPAAELAERLEVSVRTIYRDVEALSASGVPVYAERGRHGGIALLPGFRTDVTGLTADESRALFVLAAEGAHAALGLDRALGSALRKVMAALPEPHRPAAELTSRRILVDPDRWMRGPGPAVDLDTLHDAVFADRRLRLCYRHSGTEGPRAYTVDPYGLVAKAGVWYLVADHRGAPRLFRADRVGRATVTDDPVRRRPGVELADVWEVLRRRVEHRPAGLRVTARVRASRLDLFLRLHGGLLVTAPEPEGGAAGAPEAGARGGPGGGPVDAGGWTRVELALPDVRHARGLLALGAHLEILDPPEARAELAAMAAAVVELYGLSPASGDGPS
ncbi:helix-turn-helix transcriptional regulator [Streptomyces sp. SP18CS02]|uniref:helix-turn-helix transcriptional regulator n=1 Tax=Streptomyces sp. SP18CS02 TaxID=3002531 RepID=UPI002E7713F9|nr:WYL domain-containing protein [Streptomyces sp. SP18CS02]MEE1757071.1 WYL domain-containing protein [Streptomyces sp. SP18CS02]